LGEGNNKQLRKVEGEKRKRRSRRWGRKGPQWAEGVKCRKSSLTLTNTAKVERYKKTGLERRGATSHDVTGRSKGLA